MVTEYINNLSDERQEVFQKLISLVEDNLPKGFEKIMIYNMPGFVVPKITYPNGYHCKPELPLPFINIASQKKLYCFISHGVIC